MFILQTLEFNSKEILESRSKIWPKTNTISKKEESINALNRKLKTNKIQNKQLITILKDI